jgi:hypothetical protein
VGETPAQPGLQFQRGFFIVPAAIQFVNEWAVRVSQDPGANGAQM